ncbi:hypothetical protein AB6A40_005643 [Gnathostoma spinigerum]|uniref:MARVEL domain-containing protein n=1 Tax=Gnathostoma spinigerum TaxID=75299 RepID=A0ABD6ENN9_9BILA
MGVNLIRFFSLPNLLKPIALLITIIIMICISVAPVQPSGTGFIWFTTTCALVLSIIFIFLFVFEIENLIIPCQLYSWPVFETFCSIITSIFYFVSLWLCVHGSHFNPDSSAFSVAGYFCMVNFVLYAFNALFFIRIWLTEQRHPGGASNMHVTGVTSYGGP